MIVIVVSINPFVAEYNRCPCKISSEKVEIFFYTWWLALSIISCDNDSCNFPDSENSPAPRPECMAVNSSDRNKNTKLTVAVVLSR